MKTKMSNRSRRRHGGDAAPVEVRSEVSDLRIEVRSDGPDEGGGRTIVGYAAKFDRWSEPIMGWFRERIARDAFSDTDVTDVIMCFNHDINAILARTSSGTLRLSTDGTGLRFEFEAPHTGLGDDLLELVRRGDVSKCSFKFSVDKDSWQYADEDNGMEYDERTVEHISHLYDVSLVVYPAYRDTEASVRQLEEWISHRDGAVDTSFRDRTVQFLNLKNRSI